MKVRALQNFGYGERNVEKGEEFDFDEGIGNPQDFIDLKLAEKVGDAPLAATVAAPTPKPAPTKGGTKAETPPEPVVETPQAVG